MGIFFSHTANLTFSPMKKIWVILGLLALPFFAPAQNTGHPRLIVDNGDKAAVLDKIAKQPWAAKTYEAMLEELAPYVERHKKDPRWILSRYQMNWAEGKHYTDFYGTQALTLDSVSGNAPYPTVRVATFGRIPANHARPPLEELVPYDTARLMLLTNRTTGEKELMDPWKYVDAINTEINQLAMNAAVVYWLTGREEYARFAADILNQFARGAYYQNPIHGRFTYGYIGMETLFDAAYQPLMFVYDFLQPYMKRKRYEMKYYPDIWEKFANTMLIQGYRDCNWYAAENTTMVYAALLLDDPEKRDLYLEHFMDKDTIIGRAGHTSLRTTMVEWFTPDGHWKEPGGYHTFPVSNLLRASLAMEKNGYRVFDKYPALLDAATVALKYVFPNLYISSFGDSGRSVPDSQLIELALVFARDYYPEAMPGLLSCAALLERNGYFDRSKAGVYGLLCFLPGIPEETPGAYTWDRSNKMDFARFYLQRNGMDKDYGLMYTIQGATYNHNHSNGMAMELYGAGNVMGIDPGNGPYYEHHLHINYFSRWGAHNTVIAGGRSDSAPSEGRIGREIGELEMAAMEPSAEGEAISPRVSFTDARYRDKSTGADQQRTMALVRTSDKTGYYVDIFRSDDPGRNDYMYHNIGDKVELLTPSGTPVAVHAGKIPLVGDDRPGFRYIEDVETTGKYTGDVVALFTVGEGHPAGTRYMKVYLPYNVDRNYYTGYSPKAQPAGAVYAQRPLPTLMVQTMGEAWGTPFVALFEPYFGKEGSSVAGVTKLSRGNEAGYATLLVDNRDGSQQYIFQGTGEGQREQTGHGFAFKGHFGVASLNGGQLEYLYLGQGKKLSFGDYTIEGQDDDCAVNIGFSPGALTVTANRPVTVTVAGKEIGAATLNGRDLGLTRSDGSVSFRIPAIRDGKVAIR